MSNYIPVVEAEFGPRPGAARELLGCYACFETEDVFRDFVRDTQNVKTICNRCGNVTHWKRERQ